MAELGEKETAFFRAGTRSGRTTWPPLPRFARSPCKAYGEVAEWSKAPDSKSGVGATLPRVRISPSPPWQKSDRFFYPIFAIRADEVREIRKAEEKLWESFSEPGSRILGIFKRRRRKSLVIRDRISPSPQIQPFSDDAGERGCAK